MLATGGGDRGVIVRDVASGQVRETFQGGEGRFADLQFSPDGRTLYAAATRSVIFRDLDAGRLGRPFSVPEPTDITMAVSPDGSVIATPDGPAGDRVRLRSSARPGRSGDRSRPGSAGSGPSRSPPTARPWPSAASAPIRPCAGRRRVGHDHAAHDRRSRRWLVTLAFDREGTRILTAGNDRGPSSGMHARGSTP